MSLRVQRKNEKKATMPPVSKICVENRNRLVTDLFPATLRESRKVFCGPSAIELLDTFARIVRTFDLGQDLKCILS